MKKIIYIISLVVSSVLYTACDALDLDPEDHFGNNFWNNKAQVEGFMKGTHAQLRDNYQMFYKMGELRGGTQRVNTNSLGQSLDYAIPRTNGLTKDKTGFTNWFGLYGPIMEVNHFIENVENRCEFLSDADRKAYLARAYGIRALYYFMLYKTYGGVPIVTTAEKLLKEKVSADKFYVERATPEATLAFIKENIGKSESNFGAGEVPEKYDKTLWSKAATLMLKTEVYMWTAKVSINGYMASGRSDLETAKAALNGVMGKFSLLDNYGDVFKTTHRNSAEVIFTLHFTDGEATNWGNEFVYLKNLFINNVYGRDGREIGGDTLDLRNKGGNMRHEYTEDFWKTYDEADTRRDATFMDYYATKDKQAFGCCMLKFIGSINTTGDRIFDSDIIVYRYADALLMMAEIENGLGNSCASYINEVRKRAYGSDFEANTYTEGTYAENELAILHERDKEFVGEGKRWFDVVRMHDAAGKSLALSATGNYPPDRPLLGQSEEYKLLWPIDVTVMSVNPLLKQTPGYE